MVKGLGLKWSEDMLAWRRVLNIEMDGISEHRAAELAAKLINTGFVCEVDQSIAEMVQAANWQPEEKCWVRSIAGKFHLYWHGVNENLYNRSKMLPESYWDASSHSVVVPQLYFSEVIGFAEEHGFHFTKEAQELLIQAKREYSRIILPEVPAPKSTNKSKQIGLICDPTYFADIQTRHLETTTELYPYQSAAVDKLLPLKLGAMFMDMGTGKTRCAIELVSRRQQRISKVVWFTPVSLKLTVAEAASPPALDACAASV